MGCDAMYLHVDLCTAKFPAVSGWSCTIKWPTADTCLQEVGILAKGGATDGRNRIVVY